MSSFFEWLKSVTGGDSSSSAADEFDLEDFTRGFTGSANTGTSYQPDFGTTTYADDNYSNEGRNYQTPDSTRDSPVNITTDIGLDNREQVPVGDVKVPTDILGLLKSAGGKAFDYITNNPGQVGLMALLAALGAMDKRPAYGGGGTKRYTGPSAPLRRTIVQGRYGPIAQYAAEGGTMHAYANGGRVSPMPMQDGGFVMTKRAVDGAGGPQGIQTLLPQARMIRGPGTGTSDSIPAYIQGPNGRTPARVSNGEAYVPPGNNTRQMYALMRALERKA